MIECVCGTNRGGGTTLVRDRHCLVLFVSTSFISYGRLVRGMVATTQVMRARDAILCWSNFKCVFQRSKCFRITGEVMVMRIIEPLGIFPASDDDDNDQER